MNKELIIEVAVTIIGTHVALTGSQKYIIKDQLEAVFRSGMLEGKISALETAIEKLRSPNIVPEGSAV
jgi:hypothetical protein